MNSIVFNPIMMIRISARNRAERSITDHSWGEFILYLYDDGQIQMLPLSWWLEHRHVRSLAGNMQMHAFIDRVKGQETDIHTL
jgi:hypothetical protein